MVEAIALLVGGIIIIWFERRRQMRLAPPSHIKQAETLSIRDLLLLGCAQALAVIPGVSRSGAVIIAGRALGLQNILITEFSFLLAVPTMLAAVTYDVYKSGFVFSGNQWGTILIGFVVSFIVALIVIKWLLEYIRTHSFKLFGWYRVVLGVLIILALYFKII
jgi:undecaprenyl-diphosphatase